MLVAGTLKTRQLIRGELMILCDASHQLCERHRSLNGSRLPAILLFSRQLWRFLWGHIFSVRLSL
jgi:hypothetical protein